MSRTVIAVDAMGGDRAPDAVIEGAIQAARSLGVNVALAGPASLLRDHLTRHGAAGEAGVSIIDAAPATPGSPSSPRTRRLASCPAWIGRRSQ